MTFGWCQRYWLCYTANLEGILYNFQQDNCDAPDAEIRLPSPIDGILKSFFGEFYGFNVSSL